MNPKQYEQLVQAIFDFESRHYTPGAYPDLLERLGEVRHDTNEGRPLRAGLIAGFQGKLLSALLLAVGEPNALEKERRAVHFYKPVLLVAR